jgi:N-acyl-D-amino-acid deacylase
MKLIRVLTTCIALGIAMCAVSRPLSSPAQPFDIVITKGHIIDGTGSPWYSGDIGIRVGRIAAIGNLSAEPRKRTIDAHGEVVAPGFIDMLGQSSRPILVDPRLPSKIYQGITTEVTGEGESQGPLNDTMLEAARKHPGPLGIVPDWHTLGGYFAHLEKHGIGINFASYVGAAQVREVVLGDEDRQPTPDQLQQMKSLVRDAMRDGAVGLSTALQYPPAPYAKTEELIALASVASQFGGIYATHMRNESNAILPAIDEALLIGQEAHIPVEIWHIKVAGKDNWGHMPAVVSKIDAARGQGIDVSADTYAYTAWSNDLAAFLPPWSMDGGDAKLLERLKNPETRARMRREMLTPSGSWENEWQQIKGPESILICGVENPKLLGLQGQTLAAVAKSWGKDPIDDLFDLLIQDDAATTVAVFGMSDADIALALRQPWVSVDTDAPGLSPEGILGREHPHPRAYGTFPRILRKYVREDHLLTLPDAIRKFSALPAQRMRFTDRGVLKTGMWADIVVFNPATVTDIATYDKPNQLSRGMDFVLVNGVPVIDLGEMSGALPGKVLRGPGYLQGRNE